MDITHCGPVMPDGFIKLGQHWQQAITYTSDDFSSMGSEDNFTGEAQDILHMSLKIANLRSQAYLPGVSELIIGKYVYDVDL